MSQFKDKRNRTHTTMALVYQNVLARVS